MTDHLLRVRPARASDAAPIFDFCSRLWNGEPDYITEVWDDWLAQGNLFSATLPGADEPLALLRLRMLSPDEAWFGGLRVHPELHGRGAGRQLIRFARDWALERGASSLAYMTETGNAAMHHLGPRLGFAKIGAGVWHRWPAGEVDGAAPLAPVRSAPIDLGRSPFLAAQGGQYVPEWAFQRLTPARLALHAERGELYASPGGAWAIFIGGEDIFDWALLAHAEGDADGLAWLLRGLRATPAAAGKELTAFLFEGSPLLARCLELGFAPTEERYSFFSMPLESGADAP